MDTAEKIDRWFRKPFDLLRGDEQVGPDAGFAVLYLTIPLLERMIREKSGVREGGFGARQD